ncbi:MAG TPA: phosphate ABC transporter substrate-binding protein [Candidatus Sumerlaeota bacterium]|nr:phosphate ABC transporter substrate-binding protein [Candidatus Sumerlaeota bacterium]
MDGSTTVEPIMTAFAEYYMSQHPGVNITVSGTGSSNGAKSLLGGTCDVASMSRFMKDGEFKDALGKGVMPVAHLVALDGLAVVVNAANPVAELTVQQVRDIYAGRITNWNQVGGPDLKIVCIGRDTSSGTYECFEKLVMGEEKIVPSAEVTSSNGQVRQRVQSTPAAIGYVGLGFTKELKAVKINGVEPKPETILDGQYPVSRPLFVFTNGYPKLGSPVFDFVTMPLTEQGQEIITSKGFIPVTKY